METFDSAASKKAWLSRTRASKEAALENRAAIIREGAQPGTLVSDAEFAAARELADRKAFNVPQPTEERIAKNLHSIANSKRPGGELRGSSIVRRERGEALFKEFGGEKNGYAPCTHCGIKVSPGGRGGHSPMQQDKLLTAHEGGTYGTKNNFANLIPSCGGCNGKRSDKPYPVRPKWETKATKRGRHSMALDRSFTRSERAIELFGLSAGDMVTGTPFDEEGEAAAVTGPLYIRDLPDVFGGYAQWVIDGKVVDPKTVHAAGGAKADLALSIPSDLVDVDTDADRVIAAAYRRAANIAWPRVKATIESQALVAAAGGPFLTQSEWEQIVNDTITDVLGDAAMDGIVAGGVSAGTLPADAATTQATTQAANLLIGYGPEINTEIGVWLDNGAGQTWTQPMFDLEWFDNGPLSPKAAEVVANTYIPASVNAGIYESLQASGVAALQWATQRDSKVRPSHRAALEQTVVSGQPFIVGGYPMRYPGDPTAPFAEIVNCRCYISFIDGARPRRVLGSTTPQLRAIARQQGIPGRSRMNKAQLQSAIIRALCLQGMASGPECPDELGQMNKASLLLIARMEQIPGRYRMAKPTLLDALRAKLGITVSSTSFVVETETFDRDASLKAWDKRGRSVGPGQRSRGSTGPGTGRGVQRGNTTTKPDVPFSEVRIAYRPRHPDGQADPGEVVWARVPFADDPTQSKDRPVLVIGRTEDGSALVAVQLSSKPGRGRIPIGTGDWDGSGRPSYLDMSRFIQVDENYRREGAYMKKPQFQGLVDQMTKAQGAPKVELAVEWGQTELFDTAASIKAWKSRNRSGGSTVVITNTKEGTHDLKSAKLRRAVDRFDKDRDSEWNKSMSPTGIAQQSAAFDALTGDQRSALAVYTSGPYRAINDQLSGIAAPTAEVSGHIAAIDSVFNEVGGQPHPDVMFRGINNWRGLQSEWSFKVGEQFIEPKYGSWSVDPTVPTSEVFGGNGPSTKGRAFLRVTNAGKTRAVPGTKDESEYILDRGTKYKITKINDHIVDGVKYRYMDAEIV